MNEGNPILGNQLVVMSRADLEALVEKAANTKVASEVEENICNDVHSAVNDNERFLSRKEVAELLHVDLSTLWRWNRDKLLCCKKVGPRRVLYSYNDVMEKLNGEESEETK